MSFLEKRPPSWAAEPGTARTAIEGTSELDARKRALAREVFEISMAEQLMANTADQFLKVQAPLIESLLAQNGVDHGLNVEKRAALNARVQAVTVEFLYSRMPGMADQLIALQAEIYTEEELQGLVDFYRSPAGEALVEKAPLLIERTLQVSINWSQLVMPDLQAAVEKAVADELGKNVQ